MVHALPKAGYPVHSIVTSRSSEIKEELKDKGIHIYSDISDAGSHFGQLIVLAVPDGIITPVVDSIVQKQIPLAGKIVVHCSGTLDSSDLDPLMALGAKIASFHPMQAVTFNTTSFSGSWFDLEGDTEAISVLQEICIGLHARPIVVGKAEKPLLHIASVVASNYVVTLAYIAGKIAGESGLDQKTLIKPLLRLMESSLANIEQLGVEKALTGPIKRGDLGTIRKHLLLLEDYKTFLDVYKKLGFITLDIVDDMDRVTRTELADILS